MQHKCLTLSKSTSVNYVIFVLPRWTFCPTLPYWIQGMQNFTYMSINQYLHTQYTVHMHAQYPVPSGPVHSTHMPSIQHLHSLQYPHAKYPVPAYLLLYPYARYIQHLHVQYDACIKYYNMTVWIWAGNYISFTIAAGLIRLHMPGVKKSRV